MSGSATLNRTPEISPTPHVPVKTPAREPGSDIHENRPVQPSRRFKKHSFLRSSTGRRKNGSFSNGRRSDPVTPLLRWKFEDKDCSCKPLSQTGGNIARGRKNEAFSARKLAAGIWHLQLKEVILSGGSGREVTNGSLDLEHRRRNSPSADACNDNNSNLHFGRKNGFSISLHKETFSQLKLFDGQHLSTASIMSSLQAELEGARFRISELEADRQSAKKKLDHFLRKLAEEKASWRNREHVKACAIIDSMKCDLIRERKNRHRGEIINSKLVNELADAKLSAKRLARDYEKERKARELMEAVCEELAKEIGEDKTEVENLKRNNVKIREEVEEERKMLQMAEVWREERVQIKLLDAKLALEDKYSKFRKLQAELEAFLRACSDKSHVREAGILKEAIDLVNVEEIKEFNYQPPPICEDIFAVFEEIKPKEASNERDIELCYAYNSPLVSPATDVFLEKPARRYSNVDTEEDSDWETLSPDEERELSDSPRGSEPSSVHSEITRQPEKGSSITRLWRGNNDEKNSVELKNEKGACDGRMLNVALLGEVGLSPPRVDQWMKGCIEWPRVSQKHSLKAKLLEARMESHKTQIRHVLRHKI